MLSNSEDLTLVINAEILLKMFSIQNADLHFIFICFIHLHIGSQLP